jgi:hypothetical protein
VRSNSCAAPVRVYVDDFLSMFLYAGETDTMMVPEFSEIRIRKRAGCTSSNYVDSVFTVNGDNDIRL